MDEVKHGDTNCAVSVQQRHAIELQRHVHVSCRRFALFHRLRTGNPHAKHYPCREVAGIRTECERETL